MGITSFYNSTATTSRLTDIGGTSKRQDWQANVTSFACAIHPTNGELSLIEGSAFYNMFKMFCDKSLDIEIGDRVIVGSDIYTVTGKMLYNNFGGRSNEHMRLSLVKGK